MKMPSVANNACVTMPSFSSDESRPNVNYWEPWYLGFEPGKEARERGIRVMLDLVVNHTSREHAWFQAARRSRDSPYRQYYVWRDEIPADGDILVEAQSSCRVNRPSSRVISWGRLFDLDVRISATTQWQPAVAGDRPALAGRPGAADLQRALAAGLRRAHLSTGAGGA